MTQNNIYTKLKEVRKQIGHIEKSETNKFQNYKYVSEYTYLKTITPILNDKGLTLTFEDTDAIPIIQKEGKEWHITYQKQAILSDCDNEKSLIFKFWTAGQNVDIAKAKGSAETYGVKYFLQKFFMIPVNEILDPDALSNNFEEKYKNPEEQKELTEVEQKQVNEVLERHGFDILPEKCFKCNHEFSTKLLKEAKTKIGETKKLCFTCYDKIKKNNE